MREEIGNIQNQSGISAKSFDKIVNTRTPSEQSDLSDDLRASLDVSEQNQTNYRHSTVCSSLSSGATQFFQEVDEF